MKSWKKLTLAMPGMLRTSKSLSGWGATSNGSGAKCHSRTVEALLSDFLSQLSWMVTSISLLHNCVAILSKLDSSELLFRVTDSLRKVKSSFSAPCCTTVRILTKVTNVLPLRAWLRVPPWYQCLNSTRSENWVRMASSIPMAISDLSSRSEKLVTRSL